MKARPARHRAVKTAGAKKKVAKKAGAKSAGPKRATPKIAAAAEAMLPSVKDSAVQAEQSRAEEHVPAPVHAAQEPAIAAAPADSPAATKAPADSRRAGLRLEPSCTLRDALDMQFQLLSTDFGDSDVLLDGSAVERIDTAGLQMLVAFAKHHAVSGRRMQWTAASQELQRGSRMLGLDEALGLSPSPPEVSGGH